MSSPLLSSSENKATTDTTSNYGGVEDTTTNLLDGDPKGGNNPQDEEGLAFSTKERRLSTPKETQTAHLLLSERHAKFSPKCLFEQEAWGTGTASITNEIMNLVKNIVGSGGLSLPAGIAAFGNAPSAIIPAIVVILIMGILNAYSFSLLGRVCAVTKSKVYQEAWSRTVARRYSDKYDVWVGLVVTCKAVLGTWSFSIVIASTVTPLVKFVASQFFHVHVAVTKPQVLVVTTVVVLLPLCLLERISSLAFFSIIGQIGTLVTAFTMILRYLDGTYIEGGEFYADVLPEHLPSFGDKGAMSFFSPQALILVSILSTGYVAHYNAPRYYFELADHTTGRFNVVTQVSFILAALTYVTISSIGFLTFGENCSGFILDNYSYRDSLATLSRFGVALSVIFAYPLLFQGGRDGICALLGQTNASSLSLRTTTVILLSVVTVLAIWLPDLTFVLSFSGATLSSAIIYIFPPLMFQALVLNCTCLHTFRTNMEVRESQAMMWIGGLLGVCGAVVTVVRTFFSS